MNTKKQCFESQSLNDWLFYLEQQHPKEIELGLQRVQRVAEQAGLLTLSQGKTVLVAGTNGKGTTIRFMEQYLLSLGFTVGVYSSPHLFTYHERVRINGEHLSDQNHIDAFSFIEQQRQDTELTYFEFGTLSGFKLLQDANLDFVLIEVGLGGRLDATNIIEHDLAVVTSIGLDHVDWLGDDLNIIAYEKAGIFRKDKAAIIGEPKQYSAFEEQANAHQISTMLQSGDDFQFNENKEHWQYKCKNKQYNALHKPMIPVQNVATAITALDSLNIQLSETQLNQVLKNVSLTGRMHIVERSPLAMVDVAHNSHAINYLLSKINTDKLFNEIKEIHLVVAMMKDKDIKQSLSLFKNIVTHWHLGDLPSNERAAKATELADVLASMDAENINIYPSVKDAWIQAKSNQSESSLLLGVGSFYTVAEILDQVEV